MKILIISNLFPPYYLGGYEILCNQVCQGLERRGHQVVVLASTHGLDTGTNREDLPSINRVLNLYLPFDQPPQLLRKRRWQVGKYNYEVTRKILAREQPDVIFLWSQLRLTLGAARAAQDSGIPVAYALNDEHMTGYVPARFGLTPQAFARYVADNWVFPGITLRGLRFRYATCISRLLKRNLIENGVPIHSAQVIYQGIPLEQFPVKSEIGKIGSPIRILYVGQLHPYKGVHTLIKAAHRIASSSKESLIRVSIVGDGPEAYKSQLKDLAAQGDALIEWIGKIPHSHLAPVYRGHDLFVFPSTWQEPFGLTHLEAMASGTPVISTADGGQGEFLRDGENALVFEKENAEQLAEKILYLIRDASLSQRLATGARALVEKEFGLDRYVINLEGFLQEVSKQNP
jgi:glycosyltransferase involved in cell wall biosynthesis